MGGGSVFFKKHKTEEIKYKELEEIDVNFIGHASYENGERIREKYNKGIINDDMLEEAIEQAVFRQVVKDLDLMVKKEVYADHIGRPDCFAYALVKGFFSKEGIEAIRFDHGDTVESYIKEHYRENLIKELKKELLNPKPPLKLEGYFDPHPP